MGSSQAQAVFLLNLVQDVNISRPLIIMAGRDLRLPVVILISGAFLKRDKTGSWRSEIDEIAIASGAAVLIYETPAQALELLAGGRGVIVAASESDLSAHTHTHDVLRLAGPAYRTITLQHGLECVGFLQSRDHDLAHGRSVSFGAEIVCGWMDASRLRSILPSERPKLVVTGPTSVLQQPRRDQASLRPAAGLVCENLHSARFRMAGDFKGDFLEVFKAFCAALERNGEQVVLRPHPGGQYVLRNGTALPPNVRLNNHPMYKVDLGHYAYGISAPSSILIDMVLAGIPTAVWRDKGSLMDAGSYNGLAVVSDMEDWLEFSRAAKVEPQRFLDAQAEYIGRLGMLTEPEEVARRFAELLQSATSDRSVVDDHSAEKVERILFVANSRLATLQISFERPLSGLVAEGWCKTLLIDETELAKKFPDGEHASAQRQNWVRQQLGSFDPTIIVFCRYSGGYADLIMSWARDQNIPTIMHIDDDLLGVPETHGASKFSYHNDPHRLNTIRSLLSNTNLVYCSTPNLRNRLVERGIENEIKVGEIYCPGIIINRPTLGAARIIGYTGMSEKIRELEMVVPALERLMGTYTEIRLELMGGLRLPASLERFRNRVVLRPPVADYTTFLSTLASFNWDIGICPLEGTPFNVVKANTKWVEYTSVGVAVVASRGTVYDECCDGGCGLLVQDEGEWALALESLLSDPEARRQQVHRAQQKLTEKYSPEQLTKQVMHMMEEARASAGRARA